MIVAGQMALLRQQARHRDGIARTVNPSAYAYTGSNPVPATLVRPPSRGPDYVGDAEIVTDCHKPRKTLRRSIRRLDDDAWPPSPYDHRRERTLTATPSPRTVPKASPPISAAPCWAKPRRAHAVHRHDRGRRCGPAICFSDTQLTDDRWRFCDLIVRRVSRWPAGIRGAPYALSGAEVRLRYRPLRQ
jgi:hypothetical protein